LILSIFDYDVACFNIPVRIWHPLLRSDYSAFDGERFEDGHTAYSAETTLLVTQVGRDYSRISTVLAIYAPPSIISLRNSS
jgi:hypothetical protein